MGLDAKAHIVPGLAGAAERTTKPPLMPDNEAVAGDHDSGESDGEMADVPHHTKAFQGWRISYRREQNKRRSSSPMRTRPALTRRLRAMALVIDKMPDARRHRPFPRGQTPIQKQRRKVARAYWRKTRLAQ